MKQYFRVHSLRLFPSAHLCTSYRKELLFMQVLNDHSDGLAQPKNSSSPTPPPHIPPHHCNVMMFTIRQGFAGGRYGFAILSMDAQLTTSNCRLSVQYVVRSSCSWFSLRLTELRLASGFSLLLAGRMVVTLSG